MGNGFALVSCCLGGAITLNSLDLEIGAKETVGFEGSGSFVGVRDSSNSLLGKLFALFADSEGDIAATRFGREAAEMRAVSSAKTNIPTEPA